MRRLILAVVSALYDCHEEEGVDEAPASSIYLALGCDLETYMRVAEALSAAGLARVTPTTIALTARGRELGAEIEVALKSARAGGDAR
jgi:hypothetical protein